MEFNWKQHIEKTKGRGVGQFLEESLRKHGPKSGTFFDVGAGAGNEMDYMKSLGFEVGGVDLYADREDIVKADMADFNIPESDVICSMNAISFSSEGKKVLNQIANKTKQLVVATVFGVEDDWVKEGRCVAFSEEDIRETFNNFEIVHFNEIKKWGPDASGREKNWHVIQFVAVKKQRVNRG